MNRRDLLKLGLSSLVSIFFPERLGMPRLGDELARLLGKLNDGQRLTRDELDFVRLQGNFTDANNALVQGWNSGVVRPEFAIRAVSKESTSMLVARSGSNQTIGTGAWTEIQFNTLTFQDEGLVNLSADNTLITILRFGSYYSNFRVTWAANATGDRIVRQKINGVGGYVYDKVTGADSEYCSGHVPVRWNTGTTVEMEVYQDSGGDLDVTYAHVQIDRRITGKGSSSV
jgi:hypothetical protein